MICTCLLYCTYLGNMRIKLDCSVYCVNSIQLLRTEAPLGCGIRRKPETTTTNNKFHLTDSS